MVDANQLIERFGEAIRQFLTRAGKAQHSSGIFDLQRRTLMGCYTYLDHLPWALGVLDQVTTPEAIGRSSRGLCGSPFGAQIHGLLWGYLIARENELALGRTGGDDADLVTVVDWWERMMRAYRDDEVHLLPHEDHDRQPAAEASMVQRVLADHGRAPDEIGDHAHVTAGLQLYNYVLRGEQRGTTNFHGPYPSGRPGGVLLVEEFTRLAYDELPWSADPPLMPVDTVCAILELDDVRLRFDLFQGMAADPSDYRSRLQRVALLTCDDGPPRELTAAERHQILDAAKSERARVFRESLEWDAHFKIAYGAFHYLDFLFPFFEAAGLGEDVKSDARSRFADTVDARLREIADIDPVPVWNRVFANPSRTFTPLNTREEVAHG